MPVGTLEPLIGLNEMTKQSCCAVELRDGWGQEREIQHTKKMMNCPSWKQQKRLIEHWMDRIEVVWTSGMFAVSLSVRQWPRASFDEDKEALVWWQPHYQIFKNASASVIVVLQAAFLKKRPPSLSFNFTLILWQQQRFEVGTLTQWDALNTQWGLCLFT